MNTPMLAAMNHNLAAGLTILLVGVVIVVAIWEAIWKLIALWKSARNDQMAWFICLAIFNTAGILPILYILFFQRKANNQPV